MDSLVTSPASQTWFATGLVRVGTFRVAADHPRFPGGCRPTGAELAFARTPVRVVPEHGRAFVADSTVVTFHNAAGSSARRSLGGAGEHCDWFAIDSAVVVEAVRSLDPHVLDEPERPFRRPYGTCDALTYAFQRRVVLEVQQGGSEIDPLRIEELVMGLLGRVLDGVYRRQAPTPQRSAMEIAERVKSVLAERCSCAGYDLRAIAGDSAVSVYHMCRAFKAATGLTVGEYRNQLRLRACLDRVSDRAVDLSLLAADLGFADHSHFTRAFRRAYGVTPSAFRRLLRGAGRGSNGSVPGAVARPAGRSRVGSRSPRSEVVGGPRP